MSPPASSSPPRRPRVVHLMYGSGGGGHLASARAVLAALLATPAFAADNPRRAHVELVDAATIAGASWADTLYNRILAADALPLVRVLHFAAAAILPVATPTLRDRFRRFWTGAGGGPAAGGLAHARPDVVVSFVPRLNAVMGDVLAEEEVRNAGVVEAGAADGAGDAPVFLTVLTDFTHSPEHPWLQSDRQWVVCGTEKAFYQAQALLPSARKTRVPGMVVHPRFYGDGDRAGGNEQQSEDQEQGENREEATENTNVVVDNDGDKDCGNNPDSRPLVWLLLFGADPPRATVHAIVDAAQRKVAHNPDSPIDLIVVCGRNNQLRREMVAIANASTAAHGPSTPGLRMTVTGFTDQIPALMRAADVVVGKPGPGVVSEALVVGLPVVMYVGAAGAMAQEDDVVQWVLAARVGVLARSPEQVLQLGRPRVREMQSAIAALPKNDAVFQVARLIAHALPVEREPEVLEQAGGRAEAENEVEVQPARAGAGAGAGACTEQKARKVIVDGHTRAAVSESDISEASGEDDEEDEAADGGPGLGISVKVKVEHSRLGHVVRTTARGEW